MIFTSISPNTERDDIALAWKTLWRPWAWKKGSARGGSAVVGLEQEFTKKFGFSNAHAFQSGRNALYAILRALHLEDGDEVLMQGYTCVAVPEPVLWVGARPVYVDVDETLTMDVRDLEKKITPMSKVIIVQHTFGAPARLDEILALARRRSLFVIEDCAHALGATYRGKPVGSFGDAAFFSFGRDKVLSSVFGGVATARDPQLASEIKQLQETFSYPSYFSIKRQLWHPVIMSFAKKTYEIGAGKITLGRMTITFFRSISLIPLAVEPIERSGGKPSFFAQKMPNAMAILAINQFAKLDRYNAHRKNIARLYQDALFKNSPTSMQNSAAGMQNSVSSQKLVSETNSVWLRYTLFINEPGKLLSVVREARARGIELGDWYRQVIAPKNVDYKKIGYDLATCPKAESLARQSINLPTHIGISEADAGKIVELFRGDVSSKN